MDPQCTGRDMDRSQSASVIGLIHHRQRDWRSCLCALIRPWYWHRKCLSVRAYHQAAAERRFRVGWRAIERTEHVPFPLYILKKPRSNAPKHCVSCGSKVISGASGNDRWLIAHDESAPFDAHEFSSIDTPAATHSATLSSVELPDRAGVEGVLNTVPSAGGATESSLLSSGGGVGRVLSTL